MPTSVVRRTFEGGSPLPGLRVPASWRPNDVLIGPLSYCAVGEDLPAFSTASEISSTYPAANRAIAYPFVIADYFLVQKVWWCNGTTATTDSADVAVYTEAGVRLVSGGGTLIATANVVQEKDVTDTLLPPGRYWCAYAQNGVTATPICLTTPVALLRAAGVAQMATAYVLPDPFVPAAAASAILPLCGIAARTQVA